MGEAHCPGVAEENLSHLVLLLKRLDIADMGQCKFLDRPGKLMKFFFVFSSHCGVGLNEISPNDK